MIGCALVGCTTVAVDRTGLLGSNQIAPAADTADTAGIDAGNIQLRT